MMLDWILGVEEWNARLAAVCGGERVIGVDVERGARWCGLCIVGVGGMSGVGVGQSRILCVLRCALCVVRCFKKNSAMLRLGIEPRTFRSSV